MGFYGFRIRIILTFRLMQVVQLIRWHSQVRPKGMAVDIPGLLRHWFPRKQTGDTHLPVAYIRLPSDGPSTQSFCCPVEVSINFMSSLEVCGIYLIKLLDFYLFVAWSVCVLFWFWFGFGAGDTLSIHMLYHRATSLAPADFKSSIRFPCRPLCTRGNNNNNKIPAVTKHLFFL